MKYSFIKVCKACGFLPALPFSRYCVVCAATVKQ